MLVFNLAGIRSEQRRYEEARELYQSVVKQAPGSALAPILVNRLLAMAYNNMAWLTALKGGEGRGALAEINRAIDLIGPQADLLDTRGMIHLRLKQTNDAINDLQIAVKNAPSANKLFHLAQAYFQANDKEKARECLKQAQAKGLADRSRSGSVRFIRSSNQTIRSCSAISGCLDRRSPRQVTPGDAEAINCAHALDPPFSEANPWAHFPTGARTPFEHRLSRSPHVDACRGARARPPPDPLPPPASRIEIVSWAYSGVRIIPLENRGCKSSGCVCFTLPGSEVGYVHDAFALPHFLRGSLCYTRASRRVG